MKSTVISIISILGITSASFGANNEWRGDAGDGLWNTAGNWNKDRVPDIAQVDTAIGRETAAIPNALIDSTPITQPSEIWWGANNGLDNPMVLSVHDSEVSADRVRIGYLRNAWAADPGYGVLAVSNSTFTVGSGGLYVGTTDAVHADRTKGVVMLESGTLTGTGAVFVGDKTNAVGEVVLNGGSLVFTNDNFNVGQNGEGILTINDGEIHHFSNLRIGFNAGSEGEVNFDGGITRVDNIAAENSGIARINVSEGLVLWNGAKSGKYQLLAESGILAATGGRTDDADLVATYIAGAGSYTNGAFIVKWGRDSKGANDTALWALDTGAGGKPGEIGSISISPIPEQNAVEIKWNSADGIAYAVQCNTDLTEPDAWVDAATGIMGTGSSLSHTNTSVDVACYYRVVEE